MKNRSLPFCIVTLALVLNSCYMSSTFLHPFKVDPDKRTIIMNDSIVVYFNGDNYQPTFTINEKDTINHPFYLESIVFESKSGHKLNGWILTPKNTTPTVTLIHFHGNGGLLLTQYELMSPLVEQGFQVFMFDYSGFGYSEGTAHRKFVLDDGLSAVEYVKNESVFKNTKHVIYGHSFGGHLGTVVATIKQKDIDALVTEGAFSSHDDIAANGFWGIMARLSVKEMYAAKDSIKELKKPVLIIHSTEDKTIPFSMGEVLYNNANQPKEFFKIKGEHIRGGKLYANEIGEKINQMLKNSK